MNFDDAFTRLLGHEGKLSLDPKDRGNWTTGIIGEGELKGTKYGISAMSFPEEDIANLTEDRARFLYQVHFWNRIHADELPDGVAFQAFDFAVNSGIETAVRRLQRALGVADDGSWGPVTRSAAARMSESGIIMRYVAERLDFWRSLSTWPIYGKVWAGRAANNLRYGAEDS